MATFLIVIYYLILVSNQFFRQKDNVQKYAIYTSSRNVETMEVYSLANYLIIRDALHYSPRQLQYQPDHYQGPFTSPVNPSLRFSFL